MSRQRTTRLVVMAAAIVLAAAAVYAATGPLRGWLVQVMHGR